MEAINGDKLRGHLEALILATLERGEAHGLESFGEWKRPVVVFSCSRKGHSIPRYTGLKPQGK